MIIELLLLGLVNVVVGLINLIIFKYLKTKLNLFSGIFSITLGVSMTIIGLIKL